jgi:DNA polymerase-3 subunit epsilon
MANRSVVVDTETTGFGAARIVEVACIEYHPKTGRIIDQFHSYINPEGAPMGYHAQLAHGITSEFLEDKPLFSAISGDLRSFLSGAKVTAHNMSFDKRMLNLEFSRCNSPLLEELAGEISCSLSSAKKKLKGLAGFKLDHLCDHFQIDRSARTSHGALIDCELLIQVIICLESESKLKSLIV